MTDPTNDGRKPTDPWVGVADDVIAIHHNELTGTVREIRGDLLQRRLADGHAAQSAFDTFYIDDVQEISFELSIAMSLIEVASEDRSGGPDSAIFERLGAILTNAIETVTAATELVRHGYSLQPGMLLRSTIESVAVAFDVFTVEESAKRFREGRYNPTGAPERAKRVFNLVGPIYGLLSNAHTHVSKSHERRYLVESTGSTANDAMTFIKASTALVGLAVELVFHGVAEQHRYWQPDGDGLVFRPEPETIEFLRQFPHIKALKDWPTGRVEKLPLELPDKT